MSRSLILPASLLVLAAAGLTTPAMAQSAAQAAPAAPASALAPPQPLAAAPARREPASEEIRATYERMDPLSRSVFWMEEAALFPTDPVAGVRAAKALRELGRYEQAVDAAQQVLMVQPQNAEAMLEVGRSYIAGGQAFYGIQALEEAQRLLPQDWRPLSLLGVAYQQVRRNDDAQAAWAYALALSPDNPDVLTNMGMALATNGDAAQAETYLRRAAGQPGASMRVRQNLALVLGVQGKMAEAEQILRRELPPQMADANLQWLRERTTSGAPAAVASGVPMAAATPTSTSSPSARTWTSLQ